MIWMYKGNVEIQYCDTWYECIKVMLNFKWKKDEAPVFCDAGLCCRVVVPFEIFMCCALETPGFMLRKNGLS